MKLIDDNKAKEIVKSLVKKKILKIANYKKYNLIVDKNLYYFDEKKIDNKKDLVQTKELKYFLLKKNMFVLTDDYFDLFFEKEINKSIVENIFKIIKQDFLSFVEN